VLPTAAAIPYVFPTWSQATVTGSNSPSEDFAMSQNGPYPGPPWPGGSSDDEPYAEPADPWGEHAVSDPSWGTSSSPIPHQPASSSFISAPPSDPKVSGGWGQPAPRRNTPIVALVVVLGLLIVAGLGTTAWLFKEQRDKRVVQPTPSASAPTGTSGTTEGTDDARFVTKGECVVNEGTSDQPDMRRSVCTSGTFDVLKVIKGPTTGEKDAESKCAGVPGYTNWFFYDSDLDELDVVLCLKKR
jgi:hypothetical protein